VDDIMHVIPKNAVCVQINFPKIGPLGVNGYVTLCFSWTIL
jgi:hypothetical protein